MAFYPDLKPHISPSAFANWNEAKSQFVRSYFLGLKTPETSAMKAGKKIHALIEGGMLTVKHWYEHREGELKFPIPGREDVLALGYPDSYELAIVANLETAYFVDYKSGKENTWDSAKLAGDLKMKMTAWLVWLSTGKPVGGVVGFIEYIPTQWNALTREIEPTDGESVVAGECAYTSDELEAFTAVIIKTIEEVNVGHVEWLASTDEFVNQEDVTEYAQLAQEVAEREAKMETLKERIGDQMNMGGKENLPTPFGSFYFTTKRKYTYSEALTKQISDTSAAKKKFETENAPSEITKSLSFRAGKSVKHG